MKVDEIFESIQGEGLLAGMPSVFVRLAGCPLQCDWCDTPRARQAHGARDMDPEAICAAVASTPARHCVLTGGEPMMAPETPVLTRRLAKLRRHLTIETAALFPPRGVVCDLASLSPKLTNATASVSHVTLPILREWLDQYFCQIKFVIQSAEDAREAVALLEALGNPVPPEQVLFMPEGADRTRLERHAPFALEACLRHGFRYCDRLHVRLQIR